MDDLAICKRIAEIEGFETSTVKPYPKGSVNDEYRFISAKGFGDGGVWDTRYNPLTDDALCFQLMVKYEVDLIAPYRPRGDTLWECQAFTKDGKGISNIYDESPSKAICLAIIEANNE